MSQTAITSGEMQSQELDKAEEEVYSLLEKDDLTPERTQRQADINRPAEEVLESLLDKRDDVSVYLDLTGIGDPDRTYTRRDQDYSFSF